MIAAPSKVLIATVDLVKSYGGFRATDGVSLDVAEGSIHAIIGPNGAGKTTFFNLLSGFQKPTSGRIVFNGQDIAGKPPAVIAKCGIVRSFQINSIFPHLTVLENVRVALEAKTDLPHRFWASGKAMRAFDEPARALLARVGITKNLDVLAATLPYGRKRSLELAIALALDPVLLLLDEPTAGMGNEDIERVTQLVREVAKGRTVMLVEHNLRVVADLSDRITVLQRGKVLVDGTYDDVRNDQRVIDAYLGGGHA
jgi:branched-chain amino acid transport system ATP-binding protein